MQEVWKENMKDTVKKGRKQSKEAVRGWREHSLAVYPLFRTRTSACFLATFLANTEVIMDMEEKAPGTKKTHTSVKLGVSEPDFLSLTL